MTPGVTGSLRPFLTGGDRRSLARSERALAAVRRKPERVAELARLTGDDDWLVALRALDLLEKLARECPERVEPHQRVFIGPLADRPEWEIRLQVVRALPLFAWRGTERRRALTILLRDLEHPQKFVRAWALDGLAELGGDERKLRRIARRYVELFERSGSKALAARARRVRERLSKA